MAKSYLGYIERGEDAFVDWASIGKTLSDDLTELQKSRREQRQAIDDKTRETLVAAEEMQQNLPPTSSDYFMDGAANIREALLMAEKQMKSGILDPNEYLKKRQNIMDGVDLLAGAAQQDRDQYAVAIERLQKGEAGALEQFKNEMLEKYRDPAQTAIFVDPLGYNIVLAEKDKSGRVVADPSKYVGIAAMTAQSKDLINRYDVPAEAAKRVNVLGDYVRSVRAGGVMSLKDIMQRKEYLQAENDIIASMMTSPRNIGGILTDYLNYSFTVDPKEAASDPNKVLVEQDNYGLYQPKPTEEQRKAAAEAVRAQLRVQLDRVETPMPIQQPTEAAIGRGERKQDNLAHLELIRKIYSGTANEAAVAADAIRALNPNIKSIDKSADGNLVVKFEDGKIERLPIPQTATGSSGGFEQFATRAGGFLIPGLPIEQTFIDWQKSPYKGRSESYRAETFGSAGALDARAESAKILTESNITDPSVFGLFQEEALPVMDRVAKALGDGYSAKATGTWAGDEITITTPEVIKVDKNGNNIYKTFVVEFDYGNESDRIAEMTKLKTFIEDELKKKQSTQTTTPSAPAAGAAASGGNARQ